MLARGRSHRRHGHGPSTAGTASNSVFLTVTEISTSCRVVTPQTRSVLYGCIGPHLIVSDLSVSTVGAFWISGSRLDHLASHRSPTMYPPAQGYSLDIEAISGICGSISIACWVVVFSPQIIENFRRSSAEGLSIEFVIIWLAGDVFNILGAVLQGVLPTMVC